MKPMIAAVGVVMWLAGATAQAKPFFCGDVTQQPTNHPLSLAQLSPEAEAWRQSKSREHFAPYIRYVRDRFKQVQPIPQCRPDATKCQEVAARVVGYTQALDALADATAPGARFADFDNQEQEDASGNSIARVNVRNEAGDSYVTFDVPCSLSAEELQEQSPDEANIVYANTLIHAYVRLDDWQALLATASQNADLHLSLLRDGFAMWPWELWLNGALASDDVSKPPLTLQWIALRPAVGLELRYPSQEEAEAKIRFGVEPVGAIWYIGSGADKYKRWAGLSALVTIGGSDGAGFGGLLRYDNYSLGATVHAHGEVFAFVGVDLYKVLQGAADKLRK